MPILFVPQGTEYSTQSQREFRSPSGYLRLGVTQTLTIYDSFTPRQSVLALVGGQRVRRLLAVESVIQHSVRQALAVMCEPHYKVRAALALNPSMATPVRRVLAVNVLALDKALRSTLAVRADMYAPVRKAYGVRADILPYSPLRAVLSVANYVANISPIVLSGLAPYVQLGGESIPVEGFTVSIDETQYSWSASITLSEYRDVAKFGAGQSFLLVVVPGVEEWSLVTTQRNRSRPSLGERDATIQAQSPTVRLSNPYSVIDERVYPVAMTARAIAENLLDGYPIQWDCVNWTLPAYRFGVTNSSAIQSLATLAAAIGAVLDVSPAGELKIRPRYPVDVPDYGPSAVEFFLDFTDDVLSYNENESVDVVHNKFRIMDIADAGLSDRIEFVEDENTSANTGTVKVYPAPWRTDLQLTHTSTQPVVITPRGVRLERKEQQLEFVDGKATTSHPIDSIVSVVWLGVSLGGLSYEDYGNELRTSVTEHAYSVAVITYNTRALEYSVRCTADVVQFLVEDEVI